MVTRFTHFFKSLAKFSVATIEALKQPLIYGDVVLAKDDGVVCGDINTIVLVFSRT
jgi:isopentenyl phosphate kinase